MYRDPTHTMSAQVARLESDLGALHTFQAGDRRRAAVLATIAVGSLVAAVALPVTALTASARADLRCRGQEVVQTFRKLSR